MVVGVASDKGLVPDPESIATAFEEEFEALVEWAGRGVESPPALAAPAAKAAVPESPPAGRTVATRAARKKKAAPRKKAVRPHATRRERPKTGAR